VRAAPSAPAPVRAAPSALAPTRTVLTTLGLTTALAAALIDCREPRRNAVADASAGAISATGAPAASSTPAASTTSTASATRTTVAPTGAMPNGFLKGQLHAHSSGSGDSQTPAAEVHRWYEARGYDFVVFTDHNFVTDTNDALGARTLTFPGAELTQNPMRCEPPGPPGSSCALHTNALFVDPSHVDRGVDPGTPKLPSARAPARRDVYLAELARTRELGGVAMLCHPNLRASGPDPDALHELARQGLSLVEIRNEAWDSDNAGGAGRPATEALWDAVLSRGARLFGTATDDAHHYADAQDLRARGERPFDGDHGFVVVRAEKNQPSIRAAIVRGDFYASTGVILERYDVEPSSPSRPAGLTLQTRGGERASFEVVEKGAVVRREQGERLEAKLDRPGSPYLRVRITRESDGAMAWTQPIFR